mmetsp:Transcript_19135/g.39375  ORF Transcript_19135/g.39375 Transcript_19135/m.39375 type:complete len:258 (-) Transcript_19135:100-873(-)
MFPQELARLCSEFGNLVLGHATSVARQFEHMSQPMLIPKVCPFFFPWKVWLEGRPNGIVDGKSKGGIGVGRNPFLVHLGQGNAQLVLSACSSSAKFQILKETKGAFVGGAFLVSPKGNGSGDTNRRRVRHGLDALVFRPEHIVTTAGRLDKVLGVGFGIQQSTGGCTSAARGSSPRCGLELNLPPEGFRGGSGNRVQKGGCAHGSDRGPWVDRARQKGVGKRCNSNDEKAPEMSQSDTAMIDGNHAKILALSWFSVF